MNQRKNQNQKQFAPSSDGLAFAITSRFKPLDHVLIVPDEDHRITPSLMEVGKDYAELRIAAKTNEDGTTADEYWVKVKENEIVYKASEQLKPEHTQCVAVLVSVMSHGSVVGPRGEPLMTEVVIGELGAAPMLSLIKVHKKQMTGQD